MRPVFLTLAILLLLSASALLASADMDGYEISGQGACWICPVCGYEVRDMTTGGDYVRAHPWTLCPVCKLAYYWHFYQAECGASELNETLETLLIL